MNAGRLLHWLLVAVFAIQLATPLMAASGRVGHDPGASPTIIRLDNCQDISCG